MMTVRQKLEWIGKLSGELIQFHIERMGESKIHVTKRVMHMWDSTDVVIWCG